MIFKNRETRINGFGFLVIFAFLFLQALQAQETNAVTYRIQAEGSNKKLVVRCDSTSLPYRIISGVSGENTDSSLFDSDWNFIESINFDFKGNVSRRVKMDRVAGRIYLNGQSEKLSIPGSLTYEHTGALFCIIPKIVRTKKKANFYLLQTCEKRTVEMIVFNKGIETIQIGTCQVKAVRYSMKLASKILFLFWPYEYSYWYDTATGMFLRYQGPGKSKKIEKIEIMELPQCVDQ